MNAAIRETARLAVLQAENRPPSRWQLLAETSPKRRVYVFPVPCFGFVIQLGPRCAP